MKNKPIIFKNFLRVKKTSTYSILILLFCITGYASTISPNFTTKEIKFVSEGVSLAGTIFTPKNIEAAIVIVHGSGQEKRMIDFATTLANNGIAVLTYDKRGVGESAGVYAGPEVGTNNVDFANLNLLSLDASAAVNTLSKSLSNDKIAIGLIGGSQAGWIIPLTAEKNKKVKFMTIFSGALITVKEQLRFQFYTNGDRKFWDTHSEEEARKHVFNDPDKYEFIDTNPNEVLSKLSIPGIWIFGGKDIQVPANLSIEYLNALKSKGKPYEYKLFPNLGHNTAFSNDEEPMKDAIDWIKNKRITN
ncbi:alpha/beta hydrolase family protein [Flavobacterium quisquiliarum]|uniref:Alpha/beta hydrolase family protein n=1 Tax=Flavobacterium quisquiliarum TaxID=1834436 RepID=A0ABV8WF60_9FLAO|nr:alpha/beta hydrolase [Flavobacterium quisquiliarum]MBW1657541.1 prolyl oligopeptidase family serine peptidase [Flavobacterium quisquiliarum]NWK99299.1 alpha/beta hydrolase [Flavobacterium collinsii]